MSDNRAINTPGGGGGGDAGQPDPDLPNQSDPILEVFGLEGDWSEAMRGVEARSASPGGKEGQASAPQAAPAAEGAPESLAPAPAAPAAAPGGPAPPPAGVSQTPQPEPAPGAPAPAAASAATAPAAAQPDSAVQALQAQVQALQALLAQAQGSGAPPAGGQPPSAQPSGGAAQPGGEALTPEQLMDYRIAIPNDVLNAINSEDPNQVAAGIHHLVNNFAKLTHQRVMQHVDQLVHERLAQASSTQAISSQQQEMMRDYYGQFPAHDDPLNRVVVAMEAQAMWAEQPALAWSAETRNALGARVNAKLGLAAQPQVTQPGQVQQPAQANGGTPPGKPAAMTEATTRPGHSKDESDGQTITNILSAF